MDGFIILALLAVLVLFAGSVISFVNASSIGKLRREIVRLNRIVDYQRDQIAKLLKRTEQNSEAHFSSTTTASSEQSEPDKAISAVPANDIESAQSLSAETKVSEPSNKQTVKQNAAQQGNSPSIFASPPDKKPPPKPAKHSFDLEKFMMGNGLLWLGGIVLAFGGVFLAKYSIEAGLFPPQLRIMLGGVFGIALIGAAEYLYRNPQRFQITTPLISASLASGGLITCFAMTYVAFDFYAFLSPMFAFIVLAIIAVAGTLMAIRYGPILALIGIVGAYAVPALVSTGSNNIFALLIYVAFVSASAVWVHAMVKQAWIWWLTLVGNMAWLFVSVAAGEAHHSWTIFVFSLASVYLYVLVPVVGWKLTQTYLQAMPVRSLLIPRKEQLGIGLPMFAIGIMFVYFSFQADFLVMLTIASMVLLALPFRHSAFDTWPYLALALTVVTFFVMPSTYDTADNLFPFTNGYLLIQIASLTAIAYCMFAIKSFPLRPSFLLLLVLAPLGLMGLAYAVSAPEHSTFLYPLWSIELMLTALVFVVLSIKTQALMHKMTFLLLANGALTLTFTMLLSPSVLSFAIVVQIALMSFLSKRFNLALPAWIYKIAITAVIIRLTLAPWLPEYANEEVFGLHWSLVIYPLVLGLMWFANMQQQNPQLKTWCHGAMLHVIALFVTTETTYLLSGKYPDFYALTFSESVLMSMNWLILCVLYLWRASLNRHKVLRTDSGNRHFIAKVYTVYALLLGIAAFAIHADISVLNNPFLVYQATGESLFVNWLFPMWLMQALILCVCAYFKLIPEKFIKIVWVVIGVFLIMYVNGIIRGAYHPVLSLFRSDIGQQELYVYSLVWLAISVGLIVFGQNKGSGTLNKLGFIVLAVVVLKAFIVDMANLAGLYRALSFIGLGLCLVGIGWLFQRLNAYTQLTTEDLTKDIL